MFSEACGNFQKQLDQAREKNIRLVYILSGDGFDVSSCYVVIMTGGY